MDDLLGLIRSLDRCPHGRHAGDDCAGWRGPSAFDGGCLGGRALGNPYLYASPPGRIGTDVHGYPITLNDITRVAGIGHVIEYVVKMGDGTIKSQHHGPDEAIPATLEEAQKFAAECGDPLARVMIRRTCPWVDGFYIMPLPAYVPVEEQSVLPTLPRVRDIEEHA